MKSLIHDITDSLANKLRGMPSLAAGRIGTAFALEKGLTIWPIGCSDLFGAAIIVLDLYVRMCARNRYTKPYERKQWIR